MFGPKKMGTVTISMRSSTEPAVLFDWQNPAQGPTPDQLIVTELLYFGRLISNLGRSRAAEYLASFGGYARAVYEDADGLASFPGLAPDRKSDVDGIATLSLREARSGQPSLWASFAGKDQASVAVEGFHLFLDTLYGELDAQARLELFAGLSLMSRYYLGGGRRGVGSELQPYGFAVSEISAAINNRTA